MVMARRHLGAFLIVTFYTPLSVQEMAALEVAQLMHMLFTKFDSAVTESGLYKV
jgi:hypothetical protein